MVDFENKKDIILILRVDTENRSADNTPITSNKKILKDFTQ